jgi:DNA polymerase
MTRSTRDFEQDLLNYLEFCRELGIRGLRVDRPPTGPVPAGPPVQTQPKPAGSGAAPGSALPSRVFAPAITLFDETPSTQETLDAVRADLGDCQRCKLWRDRKHIVFGSGNPRAELMFVGEAPGADEDEQGLPFVGRAGQLLTKIIEAMGMRREEVYICNILKCRPPGNRSPETDEIASCAPFLLRQIASVRPKVICALGAYGAQVLLRTKEPISRLRGQFVDYRGIKFIATFHPAYLLRNPNEKRKVWEDVQKIRDYLRSLGT